MPTLASLMIKLTVGRGEASMELPNPVLSNTVAVDSQVDIRRAMGGDIYSYVKSNASRFRIEMTFEGVPYHQASAMAEFFEAYGGNTMTLTDHDDVSWPNTRFDQPEFEFSVQGRRGKDAAIRREHCNFDLKFIGEK